MKNNIEKIKADCVTIMSPFWSSKLENFQKTTLRHMIRNFEKSENGFIDNFVKCANGETNSFTGMWFFDGHIFETLRAIGHFLEIKKDRYLENKADEWIEIIADAQLDDGYLHTYVTMLCPDKRWGQNGGDRALQHEIYNAGALVEAGVQYYKATGKIKLLDIAIKFANLIVDETGPDPKLEIVTDHPLSEEAFLGLYEFLLENDDVVKKLEVQPRIDDYLDIVKYWIDYRGRPRKGDNIGAYWSDAIPVAESKEISGHAVMAALLYLGVTKLYNVTKDKKYLDIAKRVWNNTVNKKLYIHGGIGCGGGKLGEGFGPDYELPSDGYMESCGGVALGFWHHEMFLATGHGCYIDELDRVIYNVALGAISQDGRKFYYSNKLNSEGFDRWDWHICPCCPPMLMKFFGYLPELIYAADEKNLFVNLFISSEADLNIDQKKISIQQTCNYPWDGNIEIIINSNIEKTFNINLRIPKWASGTNQKTGLYHFNNISAGHWKILLNDKQIKTKCHNGYVTIKRAWKIGDKIQLSLPLDVLQIEPNLKVKDIKNQNSVMMGPVLYCHESVDNRIDVDDIFLSKNTIYKKVPHIINDEKIISLQYDAIKKKNLKKTKTVSIPYYLRCNRESSRAQVWLDNQYFFNLKGYTKNINNYSIGKNSQRVGFIKSKKLEVLYNPKYGNIHYTLNGKTPNKKSSVYNGKMEINDTTQFCYNYFLNDRPIGVKKLAYFEKLMFYEGLTNLKNVKPGLKRITYTGDWGEYKILEMRKVHTSDISRDIIFPKLEKDQKLLVSYTGIIKMKKTLLYIFQLKSAIGFKIFIAGQKIIDKEQTQGMITASGEIALKKGYHHFRLLVVIYEGFQRVKQNNFSISYGKPNSRLIGIGKFQFFHN